MIDLFLIVVDTLRDVLIMSACALYLLRNL